MSLSAGIRPKSKGVAWGNVVWHDFFERLPRRPRKKLGADAGSFGSGVGRVRRLVWTLVWKRV